MEVTSEDTVMRAYTQKLDHVIDYWLRKGLIYLIGGWFYMTRYPTPGNLIVWRENNRRSTPLHMMEKARLC